jgi:hypothetical protein
VRGTVEERLLAKVEKRGGCWVWTAGRTPGGYGRISVDGRMKVAHRVAYELFLAEIPAGLVLHHVCLNPGCVNPAHLEPLTLRENILRGISPPALYVRTGRCKHGHLLAEHGKTIGGEWRCATCYRARIREWEQARRARAAA